jgi:nuclear GTP-binding protein
MTTRKQKTQFGGSLKSNRHVPKDKLGSGGSQFRSKSTIQRLLMYKGKVKRDKEGNITKGYVTPKSQQLAQNEAARIQPDRKWFINTRVIGQKEMENFREVLANKVHDPYTVLMKQAKIPMSLLKEPEEQRMKIKNKINFGETFGPKKLRKKPKLALTDLNEMKELNESRTDQYKPEDDNDIFDANAEWFKKEAHNPILTKGQSKRIWGELYKVIDSSDVVIQVLDVRDPMGTRSKYIEKYMKKDKAHKHLVFVLNKCDLVPTWVTVRWVKILSQFCPTIAFHASIQNPFGKGSLIQLLRQFAQIHKDKKSISVGFIGYPNVGKSSVINTLRKKKVCKAAPIPGETKVWQYVCLMRRIFLIDSPGVVHQDTNDSMADTVLKSVVRPEMLDDASDIVEVVLQRVKKEYIQRHYKIMSWNNHVDFLDQLARRTGKMLRKGKPDISLASRKVIMDFQRGKLPWFNIPPFEDDIEKAEVNELTKQLKVKQIFHKISLSSHLKYTKDDRRGVGYIPADKAAEILKEVVKPPKEEYTKNMNNKVTVDWDEVYAGVAGDDLEAEPKLDEDGTYVPQEGGVEDDDLLKMIPQGAFDDYSSDEDDEAEGVPAENGSSDDAAEEEEITEEEQQEIERLKAEIKRKSKLLEQAKKQKVAERERQLQKKLLRAKAPATAAKKRKAAEASIEEANTSSSTNSAAYIPPAIRRLMKKRKIEE